jgi:hypothetical protein
MRETLFPQVSPEYHQQIVESSQSAAKILIPKCAHEFEESGRFCLFGVGLNQSFWDRPGKIAEQGRLDLSERSDKQEQVASRTNGLCAASHGDDLLKNLPASSQRASQNFESAAIVQALQDLVRSQHGFSMF